MRPRPDDEPVTPPLPKSPPAPPGHHDDDPTAESRKADHIELAFRSQLTGGTEAIDARFAYEPLLAAHPEPGSLPPTPFAGKLLAAPLWVSSMTGGTARARRINDNLARACAEFGLGLGLGSCRPLLQGDARLGDFDMRGLIGEAQPLFANLGVAQLEQLLARGEADRVAELVARLRADGLIVHVNPLQEWLQPEGDRFRVPPIETVEQLLDELPTLPLIVKEVGQGMGPASLRRLLALPLVAVEFAAGGGTNFARLELLRSDPVRQGVYRALEHIGHTAAEMVELVNAVAEELGDDLACRDVVISGGVRDFLDGHYLRGRCTLNSVYGQASAFLRHATGDYEELRAFVATQVRGLELARAYLHVR